MKNRINFIILSFLVLVAGCDKTREEHGTLDGRTVVFEASTENTKTSIESDGISIKWDEGESISVFDGFSNVRYISETEGAKTVFKSSTGISDATERVYCASPYNDDFYRTESGLNVCVPSVQTAVAGGFDPAANVALAYSDNLSQNTMLQFRNICAFLKVSVPAGLDIREVVLIAGKDEFISGKVDVSFKKGIPSCTVTEGSSRITLHSESAMEGVYIVPVLPCIAQNGIQVNLKSASGKVAVRRIIAKDENGVVSAVILTRDKINKAALAFDDSEWREAPDVEVSRVSESSAVIRWTESGFASPSLDFSAHYTITVYSDPGLSNASGSYDFFVADPLDETCPTLVISGLKDNTDYWVTVSDNDTGLTGDAAVFITSKSKAVGIGTSAAAGDIILFEDFSELKEGPDPIEHAWGIRNGLLTADNRTMDVWGTSPLDRTRLNAWSEWVSGNDYTAPGYILSGNENTTGNAIVTPSLSSLLSYATVKVSFKAAPYSSELGEKYAKVWLVDGNARSSVAEFELDSSGWTECCANVTNVLPSSKIAIGGYVGTNSLTNYARVYLDDIKVELVKYEKIEDIVNPELTVESVFWSNANISWSCSGAPLGYRIYVNGNVETVLAANVFSYNITTLDPGTQNEVMVAAIYGTQEGCSNTETVRTGAIVQLKKNVSPTSVSVGIENMAGANTGNYNPCLFVELLDSQNLQTAKKLFSCYVIDDQILSPASPFFVALAVDSDKSRAPLNVAFGGLAPSTDYWFRVKCIASYEYMSVYAGQTVTLSSTAGTSEFSKLIKLRTSDPHNTESGEILFLGFDEMIGQADYVNCAVGSFPAFKIAGKEVGDMSFNTIKNWSGGWSFYGLRTDYGNDQLAGHLLWGEQIVASDDLFTLSAESSSGKVTGTAPGAGTKIYTLKDCGKMSGWISSNKTFISQGAIILGTGYSSKDTDGKSVGMLVSPCLSGIGGVASSCKISFDALVLQGCACSMEVWIYDGNSKSWSRKSTIPLKNSAGSISSASKWSYKDDSHKMYSYSLDVMLKNGDYVAFATNKGGGVVLDNISIKKK